MNGQNGLLALRLVLSESVRDVVNVKMELQVTQDVKVQMKNKKHAIREYLVQVRFSLKSDPLNFKTFAMIPF